MPRAYLFFVYIMVSSSGTLYVGVSNNVYARSKQHKQGIGSVFTRRYDVDRLVYYEEHNYILNAIARETEVKKWRREKKVALIESINPSWRDLSKDFEKLVFLKRPDVG
ncbi:MAG TPA: GIY-YIG nuclease family protein [Terriglobales bacterium]|nr:GIY-YIG nuclease family protein [Terriglobales bacterium]